VCYFDLAVGFVIGMVFLAVCIGVSSWLKNRTQVRQIQKLQDEEVNRMLLGWRHVCAHRFREVCRRDEDGRPIWWRFTYCDKITKTDPAKKGKKAKGKATE